jgi:GNAT superfamily N-acetyltransferase
LAYRIKRVDGDDFAETLLELDEEVFGDSAPRIKPERGWWWIVHDGRELAGYCGLNPTEATPLEGAYLARAGVLLPHRGQGLQRRLIRVREALARRSAFKWIVTDTTDNPASANTLIACGYKIYRPPQPWAFNNSIYWIKNL